MARRMHKPVRSAVVGYGAAFNMGRAHLQWMQEAGGFQPAAVCDMDRSRLAAAQKDFPGIAVFTSLDAMLREADTDLVVIITPHNSHARLAIKCLNAGKNAIVEKPMCITVKEATAMIDAAKKAKVMLSVFHNRRWDGDHMAILEVIAKGIIGDVFHLEACGGGYGHPGKWWRAEKNISGGAFYDWGAHFVDWVLRIIPEKMTAVTGFFHKRVWLDATNEDQVEAVIRFESGAVADVQLSHISMAGKPRWRILGTKGAIVDQDGSLRVTTQLKGYSARMDVKYKETDWRAYYSNIAGHLLRGEPLAVTPESARRVIAVIETAEKSSKAGRSLAVPYQ
jgi:scyllo-inositol 2-dehydrogenase (NADP+)